MRIAVIGLGVIGKVHIKVIRETENELVAVCDSDKEKLSLYPEAVGYTDYITMLDEAKPDIVHICTPHYLHTEMILAGLERNVNVLCEKPICTKKEDIPLILEAETRSKGQLGICFQNRYSPSTIFAQEYLKDKKLVSAYGRLMWRRDENYYAQGEWRGKKATEGGGVLINQAIHVLDLLQMIAGMPKQIKAWTENLSLQHVIEVEDTATVFGCGGETDFCLMATNVAGKDYPTEMVFTTETETVRLLSDGVYVGDRYYDCNTKGEFFGKKVYGVGHRGLIYDFYDCIKNGDKFPVNGVESVKAIKLVLSAYESMGKEIEIR